MERTLEVCCNGSTSRFTAQRLNRASLYGSKRRVPVDAEGRPCQTAALTRDGRFLLPKGSTATLYLDTDGDVVERAELRTADEPLVEEQGQQAQSAQAEDVLDCTVRQVFGLAPIAISESLEALLGNTGICRLQDMSRWIRIRDGRGRDARVRMAPARRTPRPQVRTVGGRVVESVRFIKTPMPKTYDSLRARCADDAELAELLVEADPKTDLEAAGRRAGPTDRVLLDPDGRVLYAASEVEVVYGRDGRELDRRSPTDTPANVDGDLPLVWTGHKLSRSESARRFAFTRNVQLRHVDGLTYDFLFAMARELHEADALVLIGAGPQGRAPILLERNGLPYRGFLEGRVDGDRYLLVLHLTHLELTSAAEVSL